MQPQALIGAAPYLLAPGSGGIPAPLAEALSAAMQSQSAAPALVETLPKSSKEAVNNSDSEKEATTTSVSSSSSQKKGTPPVALDKYFQLPTATQMEDPDRAYRDFAHVPNNYSFKMAVGDPKGKTVAGKNFPAKLHEILSRTDVSDIVSWSPHGRSWRVYKPKAFEEKIIPQYFRHGKYNSFTRQVNGWGFRRIKHGPDHNAYYHEFFLRGLPHLCKRMCRVSPASQARAENYCNAEPEFYRVCGISPLPDLNGEIPKIKPAQSYSEADKVQFPKSRDTSKDKNSLSQAATKSPPKEPIPSNPEDILALIQQQQSREANNTLFDPSHQQQLIQAQYLNALGSNPQLINLPSQLLSQDVPNAGSGSAVLSQLIGGGQDPLQQRLLAQRALLSSLQEAQQGGQRLSGVGIQNAAAIPYMNSLQSSQFNPNQANPPRDSSNPPGSGFPFF